MNEVLLQVYFSEYNHFLSYSCYSSNSFTSALPSCLLWQLKRFFLWYFTRRYVHKICRGRERMSAVEKGKKVVVITIKYTFFRWNYTKLQKMETFSIIFLHNHFLQQYYNYYLLYWTTCQIWASLEYPTRGPITQPTDGVSNPWSSLRIWELIHKGFLSLPINATMYREWFGDIFEILSVLFAEVHTIFWMHKRQQGSTLFFLVAVEIEKLAEFPVRNI